MAKAKPAKSSKPVAKKPVVAVLGKPKKGDKAYKKGSYSVALFHYKKASQRI